TKTNHHGVSKLHMRCSFGHSFRGWLFHAGPLRPVEIKALMPLDRDQYKLNVNVSSAHCETWRPSFLAVSNLIFLAAAIAFSDNPEGKPLTTVMFVTSPVAAR